MYIFAQLTKGKESWHEKLGLWSLFLPKFISSDFSQYLQRQFGCPRVYWLPWSYSSGHRAMDPGTAPSADWPVMTGRGRERIVTKLYHDWYDSFPFYVVKNDHFAICTYIKSLYSTSETSMLYVSYSSKKHILIPAGINKKRYASDIYF